MHMYMYIYAYIYAYIASIVYMDHSLLSSMHTLLRSIYRITLKYDETLTN